MSADLDREDSGTRARLTADDRKARILDAARRLFAHQGFHGTRTKELAEAAGVSEALLFRHFPTKHDLIHSIVETLGIGSRIQRIEELAERLGPRDGLLVLAEQALTLMRDEPDTFRLVFFAVMETPELAHEFYRRYILRIIGVETRLFARALAEADPGGTNPEALARSAARMARSFHGALLFYNITGAVLRLEPPPEDPKAMAEFIVSVHLPERAR